MNNKYLYPFLISFVLIAVITIINYDSFESITRFSQKVNHTHEVVIAFKELSDHFKSAQLYSNSMHSSTQERGLYGIYKEDATNIDNEILTLKKLIGDNADQVKLVDSLNKLINTHLSSLMEKSLGEIVRSGEGWRLDDLFKINELIERGIANENNLLSFRQIELQHSNKNIRVLNFIIIIIAVIFILIISLSNINLSRKQYWLEGFLESILNSTQNGIITYKPIRVNGAVKDFKIEFANAAIENILHIKQEHILNKTLLQIPFFADDANLFHKCIAVYETGHKANFETSFVTDSGLIWFYIILVKMGDGITGTFQNISDLKTYQQELKDKINELENSNSQLEQFAYVASHDLQEPLRKIRTFSDRLQSSNEPLSETANNLLTKIINASGRMTNLIKDLLNYSRLTQNKQNQFVPVNLNTVLDNILSDLDLVIHQKDAKVIAQELPVIDAVELQMNQLFYNLISNSLKFTAPDRQPQIKLSAVLASDEEKNKFHLKSESQYFKLVFSDNGIGFKQSFAEQIFVIFQRLGYKEEYPGTGIGLALCRKVVDNHHGVIYANSIENEGAAFTILLPVKQGGNNIR